MPTIDVKKAIQFVDGSGDPGLIAMAAFVKGELSANQVREVLKAYQNADGGWTKTDKDMMGDISAISTSWVGLQWLLWIGDTGSSMLENTIDFLRRTQRPDGSWDEPDEIRNYDPPWWMLPGRYENQLWLTSAVCCKLKELGKEEEVDFDRALDFLRAGWDGKRFPAFIHTHWMAMLLFYKEKTGSEQDQAIIKGCERFLHEAIESNMVDPGDYCAIAYASHQAKGLGNDLYDLALENMLANQSEDGGWKTNYGEKHRASFTVDALFLLKKINLT